MNDRALSWRMKKRDMGARWREAGENYPGSYVSRESVSDARKRDDHKQGVDDLVKRITDKVRISSRKG